MKLTTIISKIIPTEKVYAHCDVPCGIYSPEGAKNAAATVLKMVQKIGELPKDALSVDDRNNFVRMVMTKEEYAQRCKAELLILWTDYFKSEHLPMFPDLHDLFWNAAKLCSKNKQHVDEATAQELVAAVDKIAVMFEESKKGKPIQATSIPHYDPNKK